MRTTALEPGARTLLLAALVAAAAAGVLTLTHRAPAADDWLSFGVLGAAAALAQRLIIPTGRNHGFPLAVVFLVAGALLLPPQLVALVAVAQHVPDIVGRRFAWYITAFNTANYVLSALAAWAAAHALGLTRSEGDLGWAAAGVAAAVVLVTVNHANLAAMLRLARRRSLRSSGLLSPSALLADLALASVGVVFAQFWLSNPYLIPLALAPLAFIHRSFGLLARLRESEERFRTMFEGAPTGTVIVGLDGRVVSSNRAFEELLGYDERELVGRSFAELSPPETEADEEPLRELLTGARTRYGRQRQLLRRDGSTVSAVVAASLVHDAQRRPGFAIVMVEDLTERVRLEQQLRHSQRLEAVGQLAGGVAHDFNNLLTIIAGRTRFALDHLGESEATTRADLEDVAAAAERATTLTRQLLAFSRRQILQPQVVDVNAVVAATDRMLRRLIGADVEIVTDLASDLGRVRADRGQLEQVLINLAVNARDAMPHGGRLTIRTANVVLHEPVDDADDGGGRAHGHYAVLSVGDTGHGMDEATRSHVFEPFFTTKEPGKGTGLGLSMVYGIVAQSGGFVRVDSAPGAGSTFDVYLPVVEDDVAPEDEQPPRDSVHGGSETILLAEDDDGVRALAELILAHRGYTVLAARHGAEALRIAEQHPGAIDLLVTDVVMPGMRGPEVAEAVASRRPGIRVLYMSGYADAAQLPDATIPVVSKPFSDEVLAGMVRDTLDDAAVSAHRFTTGRFAAE